MVTREFAPIFGCRQCDPLWVRSTYQWRGGLGRCPAIGADRVAENGATAHQLMNIFGWLTLAETELYTRAVRQKLMAGQGYGHALANEREINVSHFFGG